ncbi:LysR family transcriptional regulator [Candidatus Uabimicrobium sp. HlEnr_7]|uniref:LysR family transcriptional regulator n=1 Tax=Candidatus Uabimicrobium helgolandensis TaxID=3095367 RepID=UPI0035582184
MEITDLQIFLQVADSGSISQAAKELHYVQSNITSRIKKLEQQLQTKLFFRHNRGIKLAPAGELLEPYARRIIQLSEQAIIHLKSQDKPQGILKIAAIESVAMIFLPPILINFHKEHKGIRLNLQSGRTEDLIQRVLRYELDGAFVHTTWQQPSLNTIPIADENLVMVTHKSVEKLNHETLTTVITFYEGCVYRSHLQNWIYKEGLPQPQIMEFNSIDGILSCIDAGMGFSLLPKTLLRRRIYQNICMHEIEPKLKAPATFIYRNDADSRCLKTFVAFLEKR